MNHKDQRRCDSVRLDTKRTVLIGLAFMSICAFSQVYDTLIPLILKNTFNVSDGPIGIVMALDNVLALFMLPLFGALSDKTHTRIGRRMPYILVGTALAVTCLMLIPIAEKLTNLPLFFIGLGMILIAMAIYRSPTVALMPDVTPKPLRSKGNAIINLMGALGGAVMLVIMMTLPTAVSGEVYRPHYTPYFMLLGFIMALSIIILYLTIKEPGCVAKMQEESRQWGIVEEEKSKGEGMARKLTKEEFRSLKFILLSIGLWFFGYNAVVSGFSRYAVQELNGNFANILLVCTVAAIFSYIPVGMIASKIGRKKTDRKSVV